MRRRRGQGDPQGDGSPATAEVCGGGRTGVGHVDGRLDGKPIAAPALEGHGTAEEAADPRHERRKVARAEGDSLQLRFEE